MLELYRKERDPGIRREMIRAVAGADGAAVFRFLARRLSDADPEVRAAAAIALTKADDAPRSRRVLRKRFDRESKPQVVRVLREALTALDE